MSTARIDKRKLAGDGGIPRGDTPADVNGVLGLRVEWTLIVRPRRVSREDELQPASSRRADKVKAIGGSGTNV